MADVVEALIAAYYLDTTGDLRKVQCGLVCVCTDRQTDRQTQTHRQTDRHTDTHTHTHTQAEPPPGVFFNLTWRTPIYGRPCRHSDS